MKKILTSVASIFLVIVLSGIVYSAIPIDYTPQWNNIGRIFSTIIFDESDGTASSQVYGKSGTSKIECTLTLYKQCGGTWVYVDSVSDSTTTNTILDLSIDFDAVSGEYFKSVFEVSVTRYGIEENETKYCYNTCP